MAGSHTRLSPSGAHRYIACPGAPSAEAGLVDEPTQWAAEGTILHWVAEICVREGAAPEDFIGEELEADGFKMIFAVEHARMMHAGIERIYELSEGGKLFLEQRVDLSAWLGYDGDRPESGTLDVGIIAPLADALMTSTAPPPPPQIEIVIADWKFGAGVPVDVEMNEQLRSYGLGFWREHVKGRTIVLEHFGQIYSAYGDDPRLQFRFIIFQPNVVGGGGEWTCTLEELKAFGGELRQAARRTRSPNAPRNPGVKQCFFCKAAKKNRCEARNRFAGEHFVRVFEELDDPTLPVGGEPMRVMNAESLTPERRSQIVLNRPLIDKFLDEVHARVLRDSEMGLPTPHLQRSLGRAGHRRYMAGAEEKIERVLRFAAGEKAFQTKPLSPAELEKKLDPLTYKLVSQWVVQDDPKPVLVPVSSGKKPLPSLAQKFDDYS